MNFTLSYFVRYASNGRYVWVLVRFLQDNNFHDMQFIRCNNIIETIKIMQLIERKGEQKNILEQLSQIQSNEVVLFCIFFLQFFFFFRLWFPQFFSFNQSECIAPMKRTDVMNHTISCHFLSFWLFFTSQNNRP